jgi:signal transduction histidine kinase
MILGFALVAVVPLAVVMLILGLRIQSTVRAQAASRLEATLGLLDARLRSDGDRLAGKLDLLARDPELRRLYLVESPNGPPMREFLGNQQYLLDLDFLWVADTSGRVLADGAAAPSLRGETAREPLAIEALPPTRATGLGLTSLPVPGALALASVSAIAYRDERVGLVRGGVVLDSAFLARLERSSGVELILRDESGRKVASTLPGGADVPTPGEGAGGAAAGERVLVAGRPYLARTIALGPGPEPRPRLAGLISTSAADEAIAALRWASLGLGLAGVAIAVALGFLWSFQISRPVERLAAFSEGISRGEWDEPLALESVRELQTLVAALERMRRDLRDYRERLRAGERQAAYGQMARRVAHEIKNPLTPIALSIADLKRSYELQRPDFPQILEQCARTIGEEVERLKDLLREFSDFGRLPAPAFAACDVRELLLDMKALYGRESADGRLVVSAADGLVLSADRAQLRQALLNLIQNGLDATAPGGHVELRARAHDANVEITVADDGPGIAEEQRAQLFVPGFTTKEHGSGLGLAIVERIVSDHRGAISVDSAPGRGTTFLIRLPFGRET